jgi:hypothetical protein
MSEYRSGARLLWTMLNSAARLGAGYRIRWRKQKRVDLRATHLRLVQTRRARGACRDAAYER